MKLIAVPLHKIYVLLQATFKKNSAHHTCSRLLLHAAMIDYSKFFGAISAAIGFMSFIAGIWLFVSACRFLKRIKKVDPSSSLHQSVFLINIIKWLSFCDVVYCIINGIQFLSVVSHSMFDTINSIPDYLCAIKGCIYQFVLVGGVSWNFVMCVVLLRIVLFHTDLQIIGGDMKYYHACAWITPLITCLIAGIGGAFGYVDNENGDHFQCWIKKHVYQWCSQAPIIIVSIFGVVLLGYCLYLSCCKKERLSPLTMRIVYFTVAFFCVWIFPVISRIYGMLHNNSVPLAIVYLHDMGMSSIGLSNAIVWGTTDVFSKHRRSGRMVDMSNDHDFDGPSISTSAYGAFDAREHSSSDFRTL